MTWFAESANEAQAGEEHCLMFLAVDMDFPSGNVRFWSGMGDIEISGNTYLGAGELGKISSPSENLGLAAEKKTFQLSGVDPAWIPESELEGSFGRAVTEYFGFLNVESRVLIASPEINWEGRIDSIRRVDGAQPMIEVNAENRHVLLARSNGWRYTHEHQQQFFAGDFGFNKVASLQLKEVLWGGKRVVVGYTGKGWYTRPVYGD